jgi:hypothetical protein
MMPEEKAEAAYYDYDDDEWWAINGVEVELIASQVEANKANPAYISINKDDANDDDWGDDELLIDHDSDYVVIICIVGLCV